MSSFVSTNTWVTFQRRNSTKINKNLYQLPLLPNAWPQALPVLELAFPDKQRKSRLHTQLCFNRKPFSCCQGVRSGNNTRGMPRPPPHNHSELFLLKLWGTHRPSQTSVQDNTQRASDEEYQTWRRALRQSAVGLSVRSHWYCSLFIHGFWFTRYTPTWASHSSRLSNKQNDCSTLCLKFRYQKDIIVDLLRKLLRATFQHFWISYQPVSGGF